MSYFRTPAMLVAATIAATAFLTLPALAADKDANNNKAVLVIDGSKIVSKSSAYKDLTKQIEAKRTEYKDTIYKQEKILSKAQQELEAQKNAVSAEAFATKSKDLEKNLSVLQQDTMMKQAVLNLAAKNAEQEIITKVSAAVEKEAKARGYAIVLDKGATLYASSDMDITDKIISELNSSMPNATVDFQAAAKTVEESVKKQN